MDLSPINTYSAVDVILSFGGYTLVGWDNISVKRDTTQSNFIRGIRNKNTRVINPNTSAIISISCPQTSACHDIFSQIAEMDRMTGGNGRIELTLQDLNGGNIITSNESYLVGYPDVTYSNSIENYTWSIQCYYTDSPSVSTRSPQSSLFDVGMNFLNRI